MSGTFTRKEASELHNISIETFLYREKVLGIKPIFKKQKEKTKLYTLPQIEKIVNFQKHTGSKKIKIPEVIYVTQTYHIYESKMNYESI